MTSLFHMVRTIIEVELPQFNPLLAQVRKLRLGEVKWLAESYLARYQHGGTLIGSYQVQVSHRARWSQGFRMSALWSRSTWVCHCDQTSLGNSSAHIREAELAGVGQGSQSEQGPEKLSLDPSQLHSSPGWSKNGHRMGTESLTQEE